MKTIFKVAVFMLVLSGCFLTYSKASAKTLDDLYTDLQKLEQKQQEQEDNKEQLAKDKEQTIKDIHLTNAEIVKVDLDIIQTRNDIETKKIEIEVTKDNIAKTKVVISERNEEIQRLLRYFQKSRGISHYFKFLFGASDFNDLARRFVAVRRLGEYNNSIIIDMEDQLVKLNQLETDLTIKKHQLEEQELALNKKQKDLDVLKGQLAIKLSSIGDSISEIEELGETVEHQIKSQKEVISYYESQGCNRSDELSSCVDSVPLDSKFYAPVNGGRITSNYGPRTFYLNGRLYSDFHSGIDISNGYNNVYAAATGTVVYAYRDYSNSTPGGNCILMNHIVNGIKYTTAYYHLSAIYVKTGDVVTNLDVIGKIGNTGTATTGAHLHFTITTKWRYGTGSDSYTSYSDYIKYSIDPRRVLNFPARGSSWTGRNIGK